MANRLGGAIDADFLLQVVDAHMSVVPGKRRGRAKFFGQHLNSLRSEPSFGSFTVFPEIDTTCAAVAIQIIFADQSFVGEVAIYRGC